MLKVRSCLVAVLAATALAGQLAAQTTGTISGRVVNAGTRAPLALARVTVADRTAQTDSDGRFVVTDMPAGTYAVRARMLGYGPATDTVRVVAGQTVTVELALDPQAVSLSAIVVTGYGEQKAGNITGAVQEVSATEFNPGVVVSPAQLISGKVAGVQVVDNNEPGGGLSLRIRGPTSVNASSEPLYVIDGQPISTGAGGGINAGRDALNFLNPNDIASMTVLKDASAAAIYGANAANGVVLIQTKRGEGAPHLRYTGTASASTVTKVPDLLNAAQFQAAVEEYAPSRVDSLLGANTDWYGEIDRTAFGQEHNVALSGSSGSNDYRVSVGYLNQKGIILASNTERLSLGVAFDQRLFDDNLTLNVNLKGARTNDQFTPGDVLGNAAAMAPTQPILDPTSPTGYWDWHTTNASPSNPVASINLASNRGTTYRSIGSVQGKYILPFFPKLTANINLAYDAGKADRQIFNPNNLAAQVRQGHGQLNQSTGTDLNTVLETYLNFATRGGPGDIDLTGGYSYTNQHSDWLYYNAAGLSSNLLGDNGIVPADNVTNNEYITDYKLISFFGRLNYNIQDRYLLAASVRRDGSSRFGAGNQWGTFPSVSGAWRISQESFLRDWEALSELKIRASWAKTGNQAFGDYLQYSTYTYSDPLTQYQFGDQFVSTIRPSAVDPNIHWEETDAFNIGLDFGFLNQRVSGAVEVYQKKTKDLIFYVPVAAGTNLSNYVTTNVGSMKNNGFEISLNAELLQGGPSSLNWTAGFNASYNTNELTSINPSQSVSKILTGGISGGVGNLVQVLQPGVPINSFFVYQQEYDETGKPIEGSFVDLNEDGVINDSDRRPFHDPAPKWILSHSSYVTWNRFDMGFVLRAYLGSYVYNNVASALGAYQNLTGSAMPSNLQASVLETGFVVPQYYSDYYIESGSFLRMDNITIGYTFLYNGQPWRVFATVQNAFTLTGYSGVDPTAGLNGIDNNIYPRSRTFSGGVNVRF
ncbi:MAG: SusC/RagA family TonB-linked outer membrane protein [Gemmatimonadales bacterium]|nr:SusC/RagA family TonB-linked outer membrane protein [Gemmatimonadales bacterium]